MDDKSEALAAAIDDLLRAGYQPRPIVVTGDEIDIMLSRQNGPYIDTLQIPEYGNATVLRAIARYDASRPFDHGSKVWCDKSMPVLKAVLFTLSLSENGDEPDTWLARGTQAGILGPMLSGSELTQ